MPSLGHFALGFHGHGMEQAMFGEFRIRVGFPVKHVDQVVEIVMMLFGNVFDEQVPWHSTALDHRLIHRKDVGVHLGFIRHQRTGRV